MRGSRADGLLLPGVPGEPGAWAEGSPAVQQHRAGGPGAFLELGQMQCPRSSGLSLVDSCVVTHFCVTLPLGLSSR